MGTAERKLASIGLKVLAVSVGFIIVGYFGVYRERPVRNAHSDSINIEADLMAIAKEINKNLPAHINEGIVAESTMAGPGNSFMYVYTLTNVSSKDMNEEQLKQEYSRDMTNWVCTNPQMAQFREDKTVLLYQYRGNDGKFIGQIRIQSADCEQ